VTEGLVVVPADRACAAALVAFVACVAAAYGARRVLLHQRAARFARVDADGGSALLGQGAMNVFHWALQPLGAACVALGIGANTITFVSLILGVAAGVALADGMFGLGALLSGISSMCDALDGLVARKTGTASDSGEVFDAAVDRYVELFFLGGLAYFYRDQPWSLVACVAALGGSFMVSYATAKAEALHVKAPRGSMRRPERAAYLVAGATLTPLLESNLSLGTATLTPMLAAVVLVAVVANYSAAARLFAIARALHRPRPAGPADSGHAPAASIPLPEERS
jgi:phosphatidylglycerophosphate synthase